MRVAKVAGVSENFDFCGGQFPADFAQGCSVAGGENQIAAFGGEGTGDGESDAAAGAGDEGDVVEQL